MIPKHGGRDCELSTTGIDADGAIHPDEVTRAILNHIPTALCSRGGHVWCGQGTYFNTSYSTDYLRRWASNGGCHYGDLGPVECCTPTCLDPFEFARRSILMVQIAEEARRLAQACENEDVSYALSTANVDAADPAISYGSHISMAVEKELWKDLFNGHRRPGRLAMVASGIAAAIAFFGAGYLLPLKDRTIYSLSGRAHHLTSVSTLSTTEPFKRGLLNRRKEPHGTGFERLHLIGFDLCLSSGAMLFSFLQCLLAAAEESYCKLQITDPVHAVRSWSWGLDLESGRMPVTACLIDERQLTLPQYLRELTETLLAMCEKGLIPPSVAPHATELLPHIIDLTAHAAAGRVERCARHLTWASKLLCLLNHCQSEGCLLGDPSARLLDHDFVNTDTERGLFWNLWKQGEIDPLVESNDVESGWCTPPVDTRDYARGRLIELFGAQITDVDWSYVELTRSANGSWPRFRIDLPSLDGMGRDELDALLSSSGNPDTLIDRLEGSQAARTMDPVEDLMPHLTNRFRFDA